MIRTPLLALSLAVPLFVSAQQSTDAIRLPSGEPLVGCYYFTHWWEPWKSDDSVVLEDFQTLRDMGFNTVFIDHEWSQMIDGNWRLLDRGHRLAREKGIVILPWLSLKVWSDIGTSPERLQLIRDMYGVEVAPALTADGETRGIRPYDPGALAAGTQYVTDYLERYLEHGAVLHVMRNGAACPAVALSVELGWEGSCDDTTKLMFRLWLRARFADDIQALNQAWGTAIAGFADIDLCDTSLFDLTAHTTGEAEFPAAVEDQVEFRSQVIDTALAEMKRRLLLRFPNLVIVTEMPYQLAADHPHAEGYRVLYGCNPSSAYSADILLLRATDALSQAEEEALAAYKKRTGQQIILTHRTYANWGPDVLEGISPPERFVDIYADQAGRVAEGFGFYSWNEMVDTHIAPDPVPAVRGGPQNSEETFRAALRTWHAMARRFIDAKTVAPE
jgi:hypothetical protein